MNDNVEQRLRTMLRNWQTMSVSPNEEAESTADEFEASFYLFIDALREWVYQLDPQPQTLEELFELPAIQGLIDQLPGPLYLNFETEAELILENKLRIEEDKYD
ncbi:hypothetical protein ACFPYJ_01980 [Paenibacillus solisilvae]|uniref:Uncharacterized protein n=1 Tax=Paenibacillus solisilvae TaxID=2486751 RepID=A0ABW0VR01_9BACL